MLGQTLFLIAIIAIFATSTIAGIAGYARAETASAAKALLAPALETALTRYTATVIAPVVAASFIASDGSVAPQGAAALNGGIVWPTTQVVLAPNAPSPLGAVVTVAPTATAVPACVPSGGNVNAGPDLEVNGQCSAFVQESRLSLALTADAGPAGTGAVVAPLAHARLIVTLRLFAQPPYSAVAGVTDDPLPGDPHEGDTGGYGNALDTFGPAAGADDTTIHVIFACTPAAGDCSASRPAAPDRPTSLHWANGNGV